MKKPFILVLFVAMTACKSSLSTATINQEKKTIEKVMDQWHAAAAKADFDTYFGLLKKDAIFIGTDATENWKVKDFKVFSKPYFDKGKAWSFKAVERNIFLSKNGKTAWFDELLATWMGSCRGSGVLQKENNQWKIAHYVLSVTIPNDVIKDVIELKKKQDSLLLYMK